MLPLKPKPFQSNLVISGVLCGWLPIKDKILKKFKFCKDIEYVYLLHILEEVLPSVWRGIQIWKAWRLLVLYVSISYTIHHLEPSSLWQVYIFNVTGKWSVSPKKLNFPDYYNFKTKWLSLWSEKKVEIGHSLLPFHITDYYKVEQIQETAISIASSSTTLWLMKKQLNISLW